MTNLTREQLDFLRAQHVPLSSLFDATGLRASDYKVIMKHEDKSFAYGVTPCRNGGHTLRTRAGHCIQCDTAKIAYQLRHDRPGIIYIAGSLSYRLIKIGVTNDLDHRLSLLIHYCYGGAADWEFLMWARGPNAGRIEADTQRGLSDFAYTGTYFREGREVQCYELFRCSYKTARDELIRHLPRGTVPRADYESRALHIYDFESDSNT